MKKTLLLVVLCTFYLLNGEANTMNTTPSGFVEKTNDLPQGYETIELQGSLVYSCDPGAIEAGIGENDIYIHFNQNLEIVSIYLYNDSGVMLYHNIVNTAIQQTVIIPINSAYNGSYYLQIDNATGYAEGDF